MSDRYADIDDTARKAKAPKGILTAQNIPGHGVNSPMTVALPVECYLVVLVVLYLCLSAHLILHTAGF